MYSVYRSASSHLQCLKKISEEWLLHKEGAVLNVHLYSLKVSQELDQAVVYVVDYF